MIKIILFARKCFAAGGQDFFLMGERVFMKLLIVDDEAYTRSGLAVSIDWLALGIDEVFEASDGVEGYETAARQQPDIVLSDVRMPRMDGVEMLTKIRKTLPDTVFIFMSGYSDKDYLKAAIRLNAVSYVEKPLDNDEVADAVSEAVDRVNALKESRDAEFVRDTVSAAKLALALTRPLTDSSREFITSLSDSYCKRYGSSDLFRSAFTMVLQIDPRVSIAQDYLETLTGGIYAYLRERHVHVIACEKGPGLFVMHFFRKTDITKRTVSDIASVVGRQVDFTKSYFIACGDMVGGILKLYDSYSSAVIALQDAFFREAGSVVYPSDMADRSESQEAVDKVGAEIAEGIRRGEREMTFSALEDVFRLLPDVSGATKKTASVKVYSLFTDIEDEWKKRQLPPEKLIVSQEDIVDTFGNTFTLGELMDRIREIVENYFDAIESYVPENSSVYLIRRCISENYMKPMLSTHDIADFAGLSPSYACTVFKNETGKTINQYLTEFRMKKAQELLADPVNNVTDVARQSGYSDSNYFGKAFKKYTGFSPSEFRDRSRA